MTKPLLKGKILFLHGYTQTSAIFYSKTSALRKKLIKLGYKPVYLNAPIKLTPADLPGNLSSFNSDADNNNRAWWIKHGLTNDGVDLRAAIDTVRDYVANGTIIPDEDMKQVPETEDEKALPIVGIVGFSQGACLGGLIANTFDLLFDTTPIKFAILYSGFKLNTSEGSGNEIYDKYYPRANNPALRYLHVYGELDTIVDETRSLSLYNITKENSEVLKHPGGHFVPNSKLMVDQVTNWLQATEQEQKPQGEEKKSEDLDDILDMMDSLGKA